MTSATQMSPPPQERPQQNIQDIFFNRARRDGTVVSIFLVSGAKLTGRIKSFDKYSLILESDSQEQLLFKHAISSVVLPRSSGSGSSASE